MISAPAEPVAVPAEPVIPVPAELVTPVTVQSVALFQKPLFQEAGA
ncbi:hypothetical protein DLJ82_3521 [Rhizobium leguminosarum]|uniref:Uncharacterized protein n=1 Tax=Rhizobium leguminosarum TaxID=384 RepID=A0A2Z4YIE7_RHILE|nr:hypothetical protein DLJ82_3521 [Rhizobium leguminosarum]